MTTKEIIKRLDNLNIREAEQEDYDAVAIAMASVMACDKIKKAWDKIIAEIIVEGKKNYTNSVFNKGLYRAIEIIDKHLSEVENAEVGE